MAVASKFGPVILIPTFSTFPTDFLTVCGFARFFGFFWRIIASSLERAPRDGKTAGSDESSVSTKKENESKQINSNSLVAMTMITVGFSSVSRAVARSRVPPFTVRALSTSETLKVSSTTNAAASHPVAARKEERIKYFKIYRWDPDHRQKPVS